MVDDEVLNRLKRVEAEAHALRQLLLSLVLGVGTLDEDAAKAAIQIADTQIAPGIAQGQGLASLLLNDMLDELRASFAPETANDH